MTQFEALLARHGEHGVQALLENWERYHGIQHVAVETLEKRWAVFMQKTATLEQKAA